MEEQKPQESLSIVDEAKKIRDEIRAENDRRERLLADEQKLHAERLLSGTSGASQPQKIITEEEQKKQEAINFWKGTGIDEAIQKYNG
jgi:hypothetical protein